MKTIYLILGIFSFIFILKIMNNVDVKEQYSKKQVNLIFSQMHKTNFEKQKQKSNKTLSLKLNSL